MPTAKNSGKPADTGNMNTDKATAPNNQDTAVDLNLQIGETLQIAPVESSVRHYVRLIGYLKGHSVVVTTPRSDGKVMLVREGQVYNVRMLSGNAVQGYKCTVLKSTNSPYPHLHLSYPREVESVVVRNAQRINTQLIVAVNNEDPEWKGMKSIPATIVDISTTGAMLMSSMPLGKVSDVLTVLMKPMVGGVEQYLSIPATIRRIIDNEDRPDDQSARRYGVEFQIIEETDRLILHGYVYEQMHHQGSHT